MKVSLTLHVLSELGDKAAESACLDWRRATEYLHSEPHDVVSCKGKFKVVRSGRGRK
jgi:hypothetical protein